MMKRLFLDGSSLFQDVFAPGFMAPELAEWFNKNENGVNGLRSHQVSRGIAFRRIVFISPVLVFTEDL